MQSRTIPLDSRLCTFFALDKGSANPSPSLIDAKLMGTLMRFARQKIIVSFILLLTCSLLWVSSGSSNCGGNSAALAVCRYFPQTLFMRISQDRRHLQGKSTLNTLTSNLTSEELSRLFLPLSGSATYSIRNPDFDFPSTGRVVVIICDTEFGNVPQPNIWNLFQRSPAHAIGYTDGSSELVSPAQYRSLDRADFINATKWMQSRATAESGFNGAEQKHADER